MIAVALAVVAALAVHRTTARAAEAADALGETVPVVVATRALDAGTTIDDGDVTVAARPVAHVPDGALGDAPTGSSLRADVADGEILVRSRVAGQGRTGPAALVPDGWRAVAIPVVDAPVPAAPGDVVDIVAAFDPTTGHDSSIVVAADAVVVDVDDTAVTVAVARPRLTYVVDALANGIVVLALVG